MPRRPAHPKIALHKGRNLLYVRLDGHMFYLGRPDNPTAYEKGHRLIAEYLANGRRLRVPKDEITVCEVADRFLAYCEDYFRRPDGTLPEQTLANVRVTFRSLCETYGRTRAADFGPLCLLTVREAWIRRGWTVSTINRRVALVKRAFRFAVSRELVAPHIAQSLGTVENLVRGRCAANPGRYITAVPLENVEAVHPHVSRQVWALIQLQLLCGARCGELLRLRGCDVDMSGEVWLLRLASHKTAHKGKPRLIAFGPKAQAVLRPFLEAKGPFQYLFSPLDAERERHAACRTHRHQPVLPPRTDRTVGDCYTAASYRRAIQRACVAAGVPVWHPHQLRHTSGTIVRREFGPDAAQAHLGHAHIRTTEIYAELAQDRVVDIARKLG